MKKSRKLVLHRETLHSMELRGVAGGYTSVAGNVCSTPCLRTRYCDEGTYDGCPNTYENCSYTCTSGGACTLPGSCPTG